MNRCDETIVIAYLDNELPTEEAAAFFRHIRNCKDCQVTLEQYKELYDELDEVSIRPREDLTADVMSHLPDVDFTSKIRQRHFMHLTGILLVLSATGYLYLPLMLQNVGPTLDAVKVYWELGTDVWVALQTFVNALFVVARHFAAGLGTLLESIAQPSLLVTVSLMVLLVQWLLIKYLAVNYDWGN
ncbi:zf-HC2 domain-containing protein [Metallumcola ferriviriculae]|uniref:Anti-sigma-W factor RsiW n=1 Tax=Metallumcola ferriviriculae TaxID=3039180 RepID=A0AAU0UNR7_9FIRM|nr:zf-HC2 domain-containing protein [Desulfitibacteraceae bacterium MK1]